MRYSRFFRILALVVIISLLIIAIPVKPALAAAVITLLPSSGPPQTLVTMTGTGLIDTHGFLYDGIAYILFDYSLVKPSGSNPQTGGFMVTAGAFTTQTFTIPNDAVAGQYWVRVQNVPATGEGISAIILGSVKFTVTGREITLSPTSGAFGDTVVAIGSGLKANDTVTIYFDTTSVGTASTTAAGDFNGSFTVPESVKGEYTVKAKDTSNYFATATFTISQKITVTPSSGSVGDVATISGSGFTAGSTMTFYFDNAYVSTSGTTTTNDKGSFVNETFAIPATSQGNHTIKAQDGSGNYAVATFAVALKITLSPAAGGSSTSVTITGIGFNASDTITIKYSGVLIATTPATITTNASGGFTASFIVPAGITGSYAVEASDGTNTATASFAYTTNVTLSQTISQAEPGYVGMKMTVTGAGFAPESPVTISYASTPTILATVFTDEGGNFTVDITIPPSAGGQHILTVSDGTLTQEIIFFMEAEAPEAPKLLMPPADGEAKANTFFNWDDAEDDSPPVIYELQIATDANFSDVFLEITALEESSYTLSGEEKLESTEEGAFYYWRVRAVDAASNASDWTDSRKFYVSSASWVMYALISAGVLLIFFLGFWAGRRSKREYYY